MTALDQDEDNPPLEHSREIPTKPFASDRPLPPHDSLPAEMVGEVETERPPASLNELRDLILGLVETQAKDRAENADLIRRVFEKLGEHDERFDEQRKLDAERAIYQDKQHTLVMRAATTAADAALKAVAMMGALRDTLASQTAHDTARAEAALKLSVNELEEHERERLQSSGE